MFYSLIFGFKGLGKTFVVPVLISVVYFSVLRFLISKIRNFKGEVTFYFPFKTEGAVDFHLLFLNSCLTFYVFHELLLYCVNVV